MVQEQYEALILQLRIKQTPTSQLINALKKMPTEGTFLTSFFHRVETEQALHGDEAALHAFYDSLQQTRNNNVLAWLLVAAEMTENVEMVDFIVSHLNNMPAIHSDECKRIINLYQEKLEFVQMLWAQLNPQSFSRSAVHFYGDWPDHMGLGKVFLRHEVNELTDRIKNLLTGDPGALVVHGTGGLGKTTTTVFLLQQLMVCVLPTKHCSYVKHLFWLNVCNLSMAETFNESEFLEIVHKLLVECEIIPNTCGKSANALKVKLENFKQKLLFVIDDVFNIGVTRVMSKLGSNIRVLALTRNRMRAQYENAWFQSETFELPVMSDETIQSMLVDFYHLNMKPWLNEEAKIKRLAKICLGLPLAASVVNRSFARLASPSDIEKTYWELVRSFERLALTDVAVDKLGNSRNAEMTVHSLLTFQPEFKSLAEDVLSAFLLFTPGDAVSKVDLRILWSFKDFGQVKQHCQAAIDASLLRMTADQGYILHDLLHIATFKHFKSKFETEDVRVVKRTIVDKLVSAPRGNMILEAIQNDRPLLLHTLHDFGDPKLLLKLSSAENFAVLEKLLTKIVDGNYWLKSSDSPIESSEAAELFCRLFELCLTNRPSDNLEHLALLMSKTMTGKKKWYQNMLFAAIKFNCAKMIAYLMSNEVTQPLGRNCRDVDDYTALIFATSNACDVPILRLLAPHIDSNLQNRQGETALHWCARNVQLRTEKTDTICKLSPGKTNFNIQDANGFSALHIAVRNDNLDLVQYLISVHGADMTLRNRSNQANCLELAIGINDSFDLGNWLLQQSGAVMAEYWFLEAMKKAPPFLKELLLAKKSAILEQTSIDFSGNNGEKNDVHRAASRNDLLALKTLKLEMADFSSSLREVADDGKTTLIFACSHEDDEIIKFLLENGCKDMINDRARDSYTALMTACQKGHINIVKCLLEHGANVDMQRNDGASSLVIASRFGHLQIATLLLDHGADVDRQTNIGTTALYIASEHGHVPVVKFLLDRGANIDAQASFGWTALHHACAEGHADVIDVLLNRGADINFQAHNGWTPLHVASHHRASNIADLLIERGANCALKDNDGLTAADLKSNFVTL